MGVFQLLSLVFLLLLLCLLAVCKHSTSVCAGTRFCVRWYQVMWPLVPGYVSPGTRLCDPWYQVMWALVPGCVTPGTRLCACDPLRRLSSHFNPMDQPLICEHWNNGFHYYTSSAHTCTYTHTYTRGVTTIEAEEAVASSLFGTKV